MDITSYLLGKKSGGSGGTSNYEDLTNKPSINNVTLSGNKSLSDLGIIIPDISGKLDTSKVKSVMSTTSGDVYDVTYINSLIGNINTILATLTTPSNNS